MDRRTYQNSILIGLLAGILLMGQAFALDPRSYQHGINLIKDHSGILWAIWSSSPGNPPQGEKQLLLSNGTKCSYFTHDIFYARVVKNSNSLKAQLLLRLPEAQEPVSVAVTSNGVVGITFEDGSESNLNNCDGIIQQRYQVFENFPFGASELKTVNINGAHSGHITAAGNDFIITYSEGWINGGGVGGAGTGNDIYLDRITTSGELDSHQVISKHKTKRDWWPLIAGSDDQAMLVWQRFIKDSRYAELMFAFYSLHSNKITETTSKLFNQVQYYHYDVQYLPGIDRYLVAGNYLGDTHSSHAITIRAPKLFLLLIDRQGEIVESWERDIECFECGIYSNLMLVREASPAILSEQQSSTVLYPIKPGGVAMFNVTANKINYVDVIKNQHKWFSMGVDGEFLDKNSALFIDLTRSGPQVIHFSIN